MPKYTVDLNVINQYQVSVEAPSEDEAKELAPDVFHSGKFLYLGSELVIDEVIESHQEHS